MNAPTVYLKGDVMDQTNKRFDKLDVKMDKQDLKMDKLSEAMITLIKHDTKIDGLVDHNNTQDKRLNKHSETIDDHAIALATITKTSGTNEWFIRILIAALVGGVAVVLRG